MDESRRGIGKMISFSPWDRIRHIELDGAWSLESVFQKHGRVWIKQKLQSLLYIFTPYLSGQVTLRDRYMFCCVVKFFFLFTPSSFVHATLINPGSVENIKPPLKLKAACLSGLPESRSGPEKYGSKMRVIWWYRTFVANESNYPENLIEEEIQTLAMEVLSLTVTERERRGVNSSWLLATCRSELGQIS